MLCAVCCVLCAVYRVTCTGVSSDPYENGERLGSSPSKCAYTSKDGYTYDLTGKKKKRRLIIPLGVVLVTGYVVYTCVVW